MAKKGLGSKTTTDNAAMRPVVIIDPTECPFREFRDNELQSEFWGMGPAAFRAYSTAGKGAITLRNQDYVWTDDQIQPLPRSLRHCLHGYQRAEDLAMNRWEAEVVIFDENDGGKMSIPEIQLSYSEVLARSSFCRKVLSACFMLEITESFSVEHQWEGFNCAIGPEGWQARYQIYNPGTRSGGGPQHKPGLSKNGCYLVRLYYLGAWRCIWVSDQVPVDASGTPILPFAPIILRAPVAKVVKVPPPVTVPVVQLWPLLICKALLKLAAPDMNDNYNEDENDDNVEDELMPHFDIIHALTGCVVIKHFNNNRREIWYHLCSAVPPFVWDGEDEGTASTIKTKSTKKLSAREATTVKRPAWAFLVLHDSKNYPPHYIPGITPAHEMSLLVTMYRDRPLKKPLPYPDVELWKTYRWVDWARSHGLYDAYDCPRTKFLKVSGLLKLSHAPHLLDVPSTESITVGFIKAEATAVGVVKNKPVKQSKSVLNNNLLSSQAVQIFKEELREWVLFNAITELVAITSIMYFPSMFEFTTATNVPIFKVTKTPMKNLDILAPKTGPLYLQIDGPDMNTLRISLSMLHPRVMSNSGVFVSEYIESAYVVLEHFEWFKDVELPKPKAFVRTCEYDTIEVSFVPGRHNCSCLAPTHHHISPTTSTIELNLRLDGTVRMWVWVHSRMNWHIALLSESTLLLGSKETILCASVVDCPWISKFLLQLGSAFINWLKTPRSSNALTMNLANDREFFKAYLPDLPWHKDVVGYDRSLLHWMFRQALQVYLLKKFQPNEQQNVFNVIRRYFCDPDFGFPPKPKPPAENLRYIIQNDPCDCEISWPEEFEMTVDQMELEENIEKEKLVSPDIMNRLLEPIESPATSNVCDLATEEFPCGILKEQREKVVKKHEAATLLQAAWRGTWARKCLSNFMPVAADVLKILHDTTFGNQEALAGLMNQFFTLFPGAKTAYSVASGLSGITGLQQYVGTSPVTPKCEWIPYFQGVFYCHAPCKVHFEVSSTLANCIVSAFNNDNGYKLPQAYSAHKTFDFTPNEYGYTVMSHGTLNEHTGTYFDVNWTLTVLSSLAGAFHICDNDINMCKELLLTPATKLHIEEIFLPNIQNILGGIKISVTHHEAVSFRVKATSPDLEMIAYLRSITANGVVEELSNCSGTGELYWPYIRLAPHPDTQAQPMGISARSLLKSNTKSKTTAATKNLKSASKTKSVPELKAYYIQVVCPKGWPLTVDQWKRVDIVRNLTEHTQDIFPTTAKEKPSSGKQSASKDKNKRPATPSLQVNEPLPGDAYVELECSLSVGTGNVAIRDNDFELKFANARQLWELNEPGRNKRGAAIRKEFRDENLEPAPPSESFYSATELTLFNEMPMEEVKEEEEPQITQAQGPSPATINVSMEHIEEAEEEIEEPKYLQMPEQLRDKFKPLDFVPLCTKDLQEHACVVITPNMAEAARNDRQARIEAALDRMKELQFYNEIHMLGRQMERIRLIEKLFIDPEWAPNLQVALEERDNAIIFETQLRILSATKKKQEAKPAKK